MMLKRSSGSSRGHMNSASSCGCAAVIAPRSCTGARIASAANSALVSASTSTRRASQSATMRVRLSALADCGSGATTAPMATAAI